MRKMKKEDNVGVEDVHNDDNQDGEGEGGCNWSENPNPKDLVDRVELSPMQYHLTPSPPFENIENIGHVVSSD
ncbi:hypothetical protein CK203_034783 [Vitis vinifera]|uniref:Uncharacterized protein n=1 Tax=Vitis vinifera TaxID=29760 RepID=A0A438IC26_VITVI|nr:hypothetical protein CK203_034783 [Vitis vinifera]